MKYSFQENKIDGGINADDEYWMALEREEFKLPRCAACERWVWPAHHRCGDCGSWEFNWVEVAPKGTIFSWTRSWYAFDRVLERKEDVPYVTALVEIEGAGGARVLGILAGDEENLKVGAAVQGTILPPSEKTKGYPSIQWRII